MVNDWVPHLFKTYTLVVFVKEKAVAGVKEDKTKPKWTSMTHRTRLLLVTGSRRRRFRFNVQ